MLDGSTNVVEESQIEYVEVECTWKKIDQELRRIAKRRGALDLEEAAWLVKAERERVHAELGYGSLFAYLEDVFGYAPKTAVDRMRVARALHEFPALREAELSFSALRELARVITATNVEEWINDARGKNLREIEDMVRGHKRGDRPDSPRGPENHVLRPELAPETLALFREAQRELADETGAPVDDDALINALCRAYLNGGGEGPRKKPAHTIAITTCDTCQRAYQDGGGVTVEVSPAVREQAECDAARVGRLDATAPTPPTIDIPAATRALVQRRHHGCCAVPGCRAKRNLEIHHIKHREHGGTHDPENLVLLCSGHHAAHHNGTLAISGTGSKPRFTRLPPPPPARPAKTVDDDVRRMLTEMGFTSREAVVATEYGRAHVGEHPSGEALLRAALGAFASRVRVVVSEVASGTGRR